MKRTILSLLLFLLISTSLISQTNRVFREAPLIPIDLSIKDYLHDYNYEWEFRDFSTNRINFIFQDISAADYAKILNDWYSDSYFESYGNIANASLPYNYAILRRNYPAQADYDLDLNAWSSLGYTNFDFRPVVYDVSKSIGMVEYRMNTFGEKNRKNLTINDNVVIQNLIDSSKFYMTGYYITLRYEAKGLEIEGKADGDIVLEIALDASSEITVGELESTTDSNGLFRFSGNPSLSRIAEGIIEIINSDGKVVIAKYNKDTEKWFVEIIGFDGGKAITINFEIDSLNF